MAGDEKRAHERAIVRYPVQIRVDGQEIAGTVENLGALGALITTVELEPQLEVGQRVGLTIAVSGGGSVDAAGEVLRVDQEFAGGEIRRTFAIRFDTAVEPP
jgi:hypothetical protein